MYDVFDDLIDCFIFGFGAKDFIQVDNETVIVNKIPKAPSEKWREYVKTIEDDIN